MKNLTLPLFAVALSIFSCTSDDSDTSTLPDNPPTLSDGVLKIDQVDAVMDRITLKNYGESTIDVGAYFLCLGPGSYEQINTITDQDTALEANESIILSYDVNQEADGLSVFSTNTFSSTDPEILLDYVQWGDVNQARVDQAVTAGRWDDANLVAPGIDKFTFNGTATDFGSTFWTGETAPLVDGVLRVAFVRPMANEVVLANLGDTPIDAGTYWLCLGPGTYRQVSNIATGNTMLNGGQMLTVSYDVNTTADGLSVFSTNSFSSTDPTILVDYVQWGAGSQARVGQAVTAGRWDSETNFVTTATEIEFIGTAMDYGSTFWE